MALEEIIAGANWPFNIPGAIANERDSQFRVPDSHKIKLYANEEAV